MRIPCARQIYFWSYYQAQFLGMTCSYFTRLSNQAHGLSPLLSLLDEPLYFFESSIHLNLLAKISESSLMGATRCFI